MDKSVIIANAYDLMSTHKKHARIPEAELPSVYDHLLKLENLAPGNYAAEESFRMIYNLCDRKWPIYKRINLFNLIKSISNSEEAYVALMTEVIAVLNEISEATPIYENSEQLSERSFNYLLFFLGSSKAALLRSGKIGIFKQQILSELILQLPKLAINKDEKIKAELKKICSIGFPHEDYSVKWYFDH